MTELWPWRFENEDCFNMHCEQITQATKYMKEGNFESALVNLNAALAVGESPNARWNRALTLLALGDYEKGFQDYAARWNMFPHLACHERGRELRRDLPLWRGESLVGKRLIVIHEAGFGDTIMLLRYIPVLRLMGINVALAMPEPLQRLANQLAPLVQDINEYDVQCCTYDLMYLLKQGPNNIPTKPYLFPDPELILQWKELFYNDSRHKVGIAWSSMRTNPVGRNVSLPELLQMCGLPDKDVCVVSIQANEQDVALQHGVQAPALHDFADVAALISIMDQIVSIDTAALHLAGALGHNDVVGLLPEVPCWRWRNGNPWYPHIRLVQF